MLFMVKSIQICLASIISLIISLNASLILLGRYDDETISIQFLCGCNILAWL
jgi:hypothetical protein